MNRRSFAKLVPAAVALPALAAALPGLAAAQEANPPSSPLTPAEMAAYEKNAPGRARATARLHAYPIGYSVAPDFIFVAAPRFRLRDPQ